MSIEGRFAASACRTAAILLLCGSSPLLAQDIVVTGMGLGAQSGDAAYDVVTIDRDRLVQSASGRLEDILRDAAGFQQFRRSDARSAHPTSQGATLRGLGGNASSRALVLLDGVPQTDPFGGWIGFSALDPARLALVRVTRGGGSGVAGPGALAGTIELHSAGVDDLPPIRAAIAYGSRDAIDADATVATPLGGGFATLSGSYRRGDGFIPLVPESRGPADRAAPYEQASIAARVVVPIAASTELQAAGLLLYDRRERGTAFSRNRNKGADASLRVVGHGRWAWEAALWLQSRAFSSQFASVDAARTRATLTLDQFDVPATGLGGRIELRPPLGERLALRIGTDARHSQGRTRERYLFTAGSPANAREAGGRSRTLGAFADLSAEFGPDLTLTGGARIDRWWIDRGFLRQRTIATGAPLPGSTEFEDRTGWEPTARAGFAWRAVGAISLRGAGYLGWRLPTLNELYRPFRVGAEATSANAALKPERLKGFDIGIDYRPLSLARLGATVFWNVLDDPIANVTLAPNLRQRQNLDRLRSRGIEIDADGRMGPWTVAASYSFVDPEIRASGVAAALDGLRPAQTPLHQLSATVGWARPEALRLSVTGRYVARQYEDDLNRRRLAGAFTADATMALPLAGGWSVEARAENIGNTRVEAGLAGAGLVERATPRTLWLALRYGG